jgi:AraC-like DNA-binding protein
MRTQPSSSGPPVHRPAFFSRQTAEAARFYRGAGETARTGLIVISGGRERCAKNYLVRRRGFPFFGIEMVASGRGTLRLGAARHPLTAGVIFNYGPDVAHEIASDPRQPMVKYFVDFTGPRAPGLLRTAGFPSGSVTQTTRPAELLGLLDPLVAAGVRGGPGGDAVATLYLEIFLLRLAETAVAPGAADTRAFQTFLRCRSAIEEHAGQIRTLDEAARHGHIDPAYLCRLFRRFERMSPGRFLLRQRMQQAAHLLHERGWMVKQVAAELGFDDPYHFSRVFKRVHGVAPTHYAASRRGREFGPGAPDGPGPTRRPNPSPGRTASA